MLAIENIADLCPFPADLPDGSCKYTEDKEVFYPFTDEELARAKAICADCPIKQFCFEMGTSRREDGVWGGEFLHRGKVSLLAKDRPRSK